MRSHDHGGTAEGGDGGGRTARQRGPGGRRRAPQPARGVGRTPVAHSAARSCDGSGARAAGPTRDPRDHRGQGGDFYGTGGGAGRFQD
eukprot:4151676-Pleurochrysis_carterae.AAC.1